MPQAPRRFDSVLSKFRVGTRSLKSTLALYFIPISVIPVLFISIYATKVFEENTLQALKTRAASERDSLVAEVRSREEALQSEARKLASSNELQAAIALKQTAKLDKVLDEGSVGFSWRLYKPSGELLASRLSLSDKQVSYLPKEGVQKLESKHETLERFFAPDGNGMITFSRRAVRAKGKLIAILEGQSRLGRAELAELRSRKQLDVVFLNRDLSAGAASFALSNEAMKKFSALPYVPGQTEPLFVSLGSDRFGVFIYELPSPLSRKKPWGYFGLFLSMTAADASMQKLKAAMVSVTALLGLTAVLLIFIFSNRIVQPVEMLVVGMKRMKTGRVEHIPSIDSAYEIEYLIHSFNEMSRNVLDARRALEQKLVELHDKNEEIKNTQGTLVQSAKMISLGQIVAGVAHELNNPIAFIYSNMHHLSSYVEKIQQWRDAFKQYQSHLPESARQELEELEKKLEIDFILKDMVELTKSCVDGAKRTKDIVLGLRSFSRVEEASFSIVDLHEGLKGTIRLLSSEFRDRIKVHEEFGAVPPVECNLSQINQVFMNLLSNAAHAISHRGDIWVRTKTWEGDRVAIEIEDNGSGMPPDVLEKIFDPFFTTKKVGKGTGLGLSIAYGLVQRHGGQIDAQSISGKGTLFRILLPIRQTASRSQLA
jgi:two-component system, NtrC family, sensor kinase